MKTRLIIATLLLAAAACKKNDTGEPAPVSNIQYRSYNLTLTAAATQEYPLDIDSNGDADFIVSGGTTKYIKYQQTTFALQAINENALYAHQLSIPWQGSSYSSFVLNWFEDGGVPTDTVLNWVGRPIGTIIYTKYTSKLSTDSTVAATVPPGGSGFYQLQLEKFGRTYYGWLQLRMGADGQSVTLVDGALQKLPGVLIKAGQRQ